MLYLNFPIMQYIVRKLLKYRFQISVLLLLKTFHFLYIVSYQSFLCRSSRPEVFCKKGVLRNLAKFIGKHLCQIFFLISCRPEACNFIKKETLARVNFAKFLRTPFFIEHVWWLLLPLFNWYFWHLFEKQYTINSYCNQIKFHLEKL